MASSMDMKQTDEPVTFLILGTGWTTSYLQPLLRSQGISYATTSSSGREGSIPFRFDPCNPSETEPYRSLPDAEILVITFALRNAAEARGLVHGYISTRQQPPPKGAWGIILLGSTGIWKPQHKIPDDGGWTDSDTPHDTGNPRAQAEDALLAYKSSTIQISPCVLNLSGLYGGARQPWNWISRVAKGKEDVGAKGSLHLVHGDDVARAILGSRTQWEVVKGKRWIITDLRVYDWWEVMLRYGAYARKKLRDDRQGKEGAEEGEEEEAEYEKWVMELMSEEGVRALPRGGERLERGGERLERKLDGRNFWTAIKDRPRRWMGDEWNSPNTR